jgi:cysteinyl-tRNA synthetase
MALGKSGTVDIHGGGKDLIFPHHENELSQSEAATGKPFIKYWLHNGFVNIDKEKMSKSLGNILNIRDVLKEYSTEAVRLFLLSSHYRSPIDYTRESLKESEAAVERVYRTLERLETDWPEVAGAAVDDKKIKERLQPVINAMDDDFNTAAALGRIFVESTRANTLMDSAAAPGVEEVLLEELSLIKAVIKEAGGFLGIFVSDPAEYFNEIKSNAGVPAEEIDGLIKERLEARGRKDFKRADEIRDDLKARGIALEDGPQGTTWSVISK